MMLKYSHELWEVGTVLDQQQVGHLGIDELTRNSVKVDFDSELPFTTA